MPPTHIARQVLISAGFILTLGVLITAVTQPQSDITARLSGTQLLLVAPLVWISPSPQRDVGLMGGLTALHLPWFTVSAGPGTLLLCAAGYLTALCLWSLAELRPHAPPTSATPQPGRLSAQGHHNPIPHTPAASQADSDAQPGSEAPQEPPSGEVAAARLRRITRGNR